MLDPFCHEHILTCHRKHWACHFSIDLSDELQSASFNSVANGGSSKSVENLQMSVRRLFSALRALPLLKNGQPCSVVSNRLPLYVKLRHLEYECVFSRAIEEPARKKAPVGDHETASKVARRGLRVSKRRDEPSPIPKATQEVSAPSPRPEEARIAPTTPITPGETNRIRCQIIKSTIRRP